MKAVQINKYGGNEVIEINKNASKPSLQPGFILVEVKSSSLNRIDSAIRSGYLKQMLPLEFPITLGGDFSGIIAGTGEGVNDFKTGDEVYGNASVFKGGSGSLAEYLLVKPSNISIKPKSLDFNQSASLPLAGASALQGIEEHIRVKPGDQVLIHGGAGGVGSIAIELAKLHGAFVLATVSTKYIKIAKQLGADEIIDYKKEDVFQMLKNYEAVFDTVGGETLNKSFGVLMKGGILVTIAGEPDKELAARHEVKAISQLTEVSTAQLKRLSEYVDNGKIKVRIDKTFTLSEIKEAFDYFDNQSQKGKVVINI